MRMTKYSHLVLLCAYDQIWSFGSLYEFVRPNMIIWLFVWRHLSGQLAVCMHMTKYGHLVVCMHMTKYGHLVVWAHMTKYGHLIACVCTTKYGHLVVCVCTTKYGHLVVCVCTTKYGYLAACMCVCDQIWSFGRMCAYDQIWSFGCVHVRVRPNMVIFLYLSLHFKHAITQYVVSVSSLANSIDTLRQYYHQYYSTS